MSLKHISGWVQVTEPQGPVDPGYGVGVTPPSWAGDPGYGIPTFPHPGGGPAYGGGRPDNSLPGGGHVWGALLRWIMRPQINNDPTKPPGRPIIPSNELPPSSPPHIWGGGHWEPVDPGYGKPPLWGFILGPDNGLPTPPVLPDNSLPGEGTWVPTDPDYGKPILGCPGDTPHAPIWAWIPAPPDLAQPK
jgi:hypothetical protein